MTRVKMRIEGDRQVSRILASLAPNSARNILRNSLQDLARDTRDEIKSRVPVDEGDLRRAVKAVRRRGTREKLVANVIIQHGAGAKYDAYYWHFVEFGTTKSSAHPFITPAVESMRPQIPRKMREYFGKRFEREMQRLAKRRRR